MLTASQKKKENIAEYLLYMWQIEDLIRAYGLDIDRIDHEVIDHYANLDDATRRSMHDWYESLIDMMRREGVQQHGHLQLNRNTLSSLAELHRRLLSNPQYADYAAAFYNALPYIVELRAKAGENKAGELETCFNALYGTLLLRLQKKEISEETTKAVGEISRFIALLAKYYNKDVAGELEED